jgi:pimeloyl-ACP methyl ester carboxylesterase
MALERRFRPTLYARCVHVETVGRGPRVVLVHGSVGNGVSTWAAQRPLAERFTLVIPDRPGSPPNPPVERVDFEEQAPLVADLLADGAHLVGHSYGGVISLYAAALRPEAVRSLTVIEPPAFGIAEGDPDVDRLVAELAHLWSDEGPKDPGVFLSAFSSIVIGRPVPAERELSPELEQGVRTLMVERQPVEADPPLDALAQAPFPKLVVSGAHSAAFDRVCDVLEERLGAERAVLPGSAHNAQRAPGFNETLVDFLVRAGTNERGEA